MNDLRHNTLQSLTEQAAPESTDLVITVDVDLIAPDPNQPRQDFDEDSLLELAESIKTHGLIDPIKIRVHPDPAGLAEYMLVDGERRWRATKAGGMAEIRALLVAEGLDAMAILDRQFAANVHRDGMTLHDQARYLKKRLADPEVGTYEALSKVCGLSMSRISRVLNAAEAEGVAGEAAAEGLTKDAETIRTLAGLEKTDPAAAKAMVDDARATGKKLKRGDVAAAAKEAKGGKKGAAGKGESVGKGKGKGSGPAPQGGVASKGSAGSWEAPRSHGDDDDYQSVRLPGDGPGNDRPAGRAAKGAGAGVRVALTIAADYHDQDVITLFEKLTSRCGDARLCMAAGTDTEGHALVEFGDGKETEAFPFEALRLAGVEYPA